MAANPILNTTKPSMITLGYHLRKCSLGPNLQESIINTSITLIYVASTYPLINFDEFDENMAAILDLPISFGQVS